MATQYLKHQNGTLAFDVTGSGPLVICAPSLGDVRAEYRLLVPELVAAGFQVVTVDLRGHGESSAGWSEYTAAAVGADLVALVRHLNAGPALIIGTSLAAGAAVWAAAEAPALVRGLVLIGPFVRDTMPVWQLKLLFTPLLAGPWGAKMWTTYYAKLYPTQRPADFTAYVAALGATLREPGRLQAVRQMATSSKRDVTERLDRVKTPVLVVMGSRDPDFSDPAREAQFVAERLGGTVAIIAEAGHYPHAEMPSATAVPILAFAQQLHEEVSYGA